MNGWVLTSLVGCFVGLMTSGLGSTLVMYELIAQIQEHDPAFPVRWWGKMPINDIRRILRSHRQHFPASGLRKIFIALILIGPPLMFVAIGIALTHLGPQSR